MFEDYLNIMWLLKEVKEIRTRKKVQKIIFLLQQKGAPFEESFSLYQYGPYSPELQVKLNQLEESGFIHQRQEGDSYIFQIMDKGVKYLEKNIKHLEHINTPTFKTTAETLNQEEPRILEMMSTIVYFEKSYGKEHKEKLKEIIGSIKPHLTNYFDSSWSLLNSHGLHAEKEY